MNKLSKVIICGFLAFICMPLMAQNEQKKGDLNNDGEVNVSDIVVLVNIIMEQNSQAPSDKASVKLNDNSKNLMYWSENNSTIQAFPAKEGDIFNQYYTNFLDTFIGGAIKLEISGAAENEMTTDIVFGEKNCSSNKL